MNNQSPAKSLTDACPAPDISVIVINYNAGRFLQRCLTALAAQNFTSFEAIVVDNGSSDDSLAGLLLPDHRFRLVEMGRNLGFAAANNQAAALAQGRWLATLNPDAFPEPGWLEELARATRRHPDAVMFGSTQLMDQQPGILDGAGDCYAFFGLAWRGGYGRSLPPALPEGEVFSPCAAAALYWARAFRQQGGFDESYFCYFEDVDLGFRLRLQGGRGVQVPSAVVRHVGSGISGGISGFAARQGHRNALWTHLKCMPSPLLPLTLPAHLLAELALLAFKTLAATLGPRRTRHQQREFCMALAQGLAQGLAGWRTAWQARARVQANRRISAAQVARALSWSPLAYLRRAPRIKPAAGSQPQPPPLSHPRLLARKLVSWLRVGKWTARQIRAGQGHEAMGGLGHLLRGLGRLWTPGAAVYGRPPRRRPPRHAPGLDPANQGQAPLPCLVAGFNLNLEGASHSQLELVLALRQRGVIAPRVFSPRQGPLAAAYRKAGVPLFIEDGLCQAPRTLEGFQRDADRLKELARAQGARMILANTLQAYYAVLAAQELGLPCLWILREGEDWRTYFDFLPPSVASLALACVAYPGRVVFVSQASRRVWANWEHLGNFAVIPNGLDRGERDYDSVAGSRDRARQALGVAGEELVLLSLGTIAPRKGQLDLIEALALLPASLRQGLRVFLVGDRGGPYCQRVRRAITRLGPRPDLAVNLLPETPDVRTFYLAADIFVCTSRVESYPRVIMEAMAHGLPLVTTPAYGISEQVQPGVNALFYTPGQPRELARALGAMIADPVARTTMGLASRRILAELPDFDYMVDSYANMIQDSMNAQDEA